MINRIIITLVLLGFILPVSISAQLSDVDINELAESHVDKWAVYLNLSRYRELKLKEVWKMHEREKSRIIQNSYEIKNKLAEEDEKFLKDLKTVLTPSELRIYSTFLESSFNDDKAYLKTLVGSITSDSLYIEAFTELQFTEKLPALVQIRMELENAIEEKDKVILDSIRMEIFSIYDKCLLTCIIDEHDKNHAHTDDEDEHDDKLEHEEKIDEEADHDHDHSHYHGENSLFENFGDMILVAVNKDISDKDSNLSKLVILSRKYEEQIHQLQSKHSEKFKYWDKKNKELREKYILPNYNKNLKDLKKRNGLSTLKHIESDAIFLLLDPFDQSVSRKFLNLSMHNHL